MNIFVAKLNWETKGSDLQSAFEKFGQVTSVQIVFDRVENRSKGFGFVEMPNDDEAKNAINALNDSQLDGRTIVVKEAEDRPKSGGGFNNNRGGGGGYDRNRGGGGGGYDRNRNGGGGGYDRNKW